MSKYVADWYGIVVIIFDVTFFRLLYLVTAFVLSHLTGGNES